MKEKKNQASVTLGRNRQLTDRQLFVKGLRRDWQLILMILWPVLTIAIFDFMPMTGLIYAFQKVKIRSVSLLNNEWVGLRWFIEFFESPLTTRAIWNTLTINFISITLNFVIVLVCALIVNEMPGSRFKKLCQSSTYFPNFISTAVIVGILVNLLDPNVGILNAGLRKIFNWPYKDVMIDSGWFRWIYILSGTWQWTGWSTILYLGAMSGIDMQLYEAADVDGCSRLKKIWHITLPGIRPLIVMCIILDFGRMMGGGASKMILMYSPTTMEVGDIIATLVYRKGLVSGEIGFGTAVGLFNSAINLIMIITANTVARKVSDSSLF